MIPVQEFKNERRMEGETMGQFTLDIGANLVDGGVQFRVWAPEADSVEVEIVDSGTPKTALLGRRGQSRSG